MSSVLASLGLGAVNPAAYFDASAIASQQKKAITSLQSTLATINTAIPILKGVGAPSTALDKISVLSGKGNTLMSKASTMPPADLAKEIAKVSSEFMIEQYKVVKDLYDSSLKDTTDIHAKIRDRVTEVKKDPTISKGLASKYDALLKEADDSVKLLNSSPPFYIEESDAGSSGSSGSKATYVIPTVPSPTEYQDRLDTLDGLKEEEEGSGFTFSRIVRKVKNWAYLYLYTAFFGIIILSSIILGGIISSNAYVDVESMYLPNRIFYFVYGALGFPLSILGGCIKPPFWVAGIFPAYARVAPKPVQSGGLFGITLSPPTPSSTISLLQNQIIATSERANLIPKGSIATVDTKSPTGKTDTKPSIPSAAPLAPGTPFKESGTHISAPPSVYDFFSFVLVDSKNPPKYQVDGKKKLWYLSIAHGMALIGFMTAYKMV